VPCGVPTLEVAEDVYALGAGARIRDIAVGGSLRLNSPSRQLGGESSLAGTVGAAFQPQLPLGELRFAAAVGFEGEDQRFSGAIEAGAPLLFDRRLALALAWGTETRGALHAGEWQGTPLGTTHRIVLSGAWAGDAELQLGASAQPNASDGAEWVPIVAGLVHLGRYHVGIVREHLPNGFGAAMHYRLSVSF
jgi:hypothetical protein